MRECVCLCVLQVHFVYVCLCEHWCARLVRTSVSHICARRINNSQAKEAGAQWRALSAVEKNKFVSRAQADMEQYKRDLDEFFHDNPDVKARLDRERAREKKAKAAKKAKAEAAAGGVAADGADDGGALPSRRRTTISADAEDSDDDERKVTKGACVNVFSSLYACC